MYASLVATRRTRSDGKHAAGRPASKRLSLPLPGPTSSARDGPRPGRCLGSADALITAHIVDEGIRFRQVPARRSPATFGESAKASVGHLSPGHLPQKSQSRASAPPLTITLTLTVITPTTTLNSYPITVNPSPKQGADFRAAMLIGAIIGGGGQMSGHVQSSCGCLSAECVARSVVKS